MIPLAVGWKATRAALATVPRGVWYAFAILAVLAFARWHWIGVGEAKCEAKWATAVAAANARQAKREAKREAIAATIATDTKAKAAAATARTEENSHAIEVQIIRVPVSGRCIKPAGLPDLGPSVNAANAANG